MDIDGPEDEPMGEPATAPEARSHTALATRRDATLWQAKTKPQPGPALEQRPADFVFDMDHFAAIQSTVVEQLTGKRPIPLANLTDEYTK
ncbi:hypothetical protein LTR53_019366, partial [Teratosphaeriaceae sp. CCFEE 6253]